MWGMCNTNAHPFLRPNPNVCAQMLRILLSFQQLSFNHQVSYFVSYRQVSNFDLSSLIDTWLGEKNSIRADTNSTYWWMPLFDASLLVPLPQDEDFIARDSFDDTDQLRVGNDGIFMLTFFSKSAQYSQPQCCTMNYVFYLMDGWLIRLTTHMDTEVQQICVHSPSFVFVFHQWRSSLTGLASSCPSV